MGDSYKLVSTPTLAHRYQVIRPDSLPEISLTLFANDLLKSLSSSSVPQYMREILAVVNWALTDHVVVKNGWNLFGAPETVRNLLREYLTVGAQCKLTNRPDLIGLKFTYVNATSGTRINARIHSNIPRWNPRLASDPWLRVEGQIPADQQD